VIVVVVVVVVVVVDVGPGIKQSALLLDDLRTSPFLFFLNPFGIL